VKRYSSHLRVLVLEQAQFPRHHVGESLLAAASPVLHEMGVYEKVNRYGLVEKLGASYVWGKDRRPWGFEFDNLITSLVQQGRRLPEMFTKGWHVRRAEYDQLLLESAMDRGAEVCFGTRGTGVLMDASGERVTGIQFRCGEECREVRCTLLVDASGQNGFLAQKFGLRQYDERMNNYALWAYWKGAKWIKKYVGHPNLARIFVATTPRGWIWYIPVRSDTISVGLVTHREILRESKYDPEALYHEEIDGCPEIEGLLDGAQMIRISEDQDRDVCAIQDWSYNSRQIAGPGWALVGDAAGFVDPILSSGVMLAHELGQKAAYTINSAFRTESEEKRRAYWRFYEQTYRKYLEAYRNMAAFWYRNNFSMESWWWESRRGLDGGQGGMDLTSPEMFMRLASGYANRAESLSLFGSYPLQEAQSLVAGLFGEKAVSNDWAERYSGREPRLDERAERTGGMYYFGGRVQETQRLVNRETAKYIDLHPGEDAILDLLDGSRNLEELNRIVDIIRVANPHVPIRTGTELLAQLDQIALLRVTAA